MIRRCFCAAATLALALPLAAARLPQNVLPTHYQIRFEPDLQTETFQGDETIDVRVKEPTDRIVVNSVDLTLSDVTVTAGGVAQSPDVTILPADETATLMLARPVSAGEARIHIHFNAPLSAKLRGLYVSRTARRKYVATQFEATYARHAFPSFDEPAMKATFDISVAADDGDTAISNSRIAADTAGPSAGKHTIRFATSPKMSTYLVALVVGDFKCSEGSADGIPIRACAIPEKLALTPYAVQAAEKSLSFYDSYYGVKYPFGKLDLIALPDFEAGAMENIGAITFRESAMLVDEKTATLESKQRVASVVAHEIAHQWFGDLVTLAWWDDLWLNEGFATWAAPKPVHAWHSDWSTTADEAQGTSSALSGDALPSTRPIRLHTTSTAEIETLFDGIAYGKAAAMLRMTQSFIGDDLYRQGVHDYIEHFKYSNAAAENFWDTVAATTHQPVDRIMSSYVDQAGSPLVTASAECSGGSTQLHLSQRRMFADRAHFNQANEQKWVVPITVRDLDDPARAPLKFLLTDREQTFTTPGCHQHLFINREGRGLYRSQHAAQMLDAPAGLLKALDAAEQSMLLNDDWALVRLGIRPVAEHLALIDRLRGSRDGIVMDVVSSQLGAIASTLVTPDELPRFRAWVADFARPILSDTGWNAAANESPDRRQLRSAALTMLGSVARDEATIHEARQIVDQAMTGTSTYDPLTIGLATGIAARSGDAALFDQYWAHVQTAKTPAEKERYLRALSAFTEPALVRRTIDLALSPDVRSQDTPGLLFGAMQNPETNAIAWPYLKQHWEDIEKKLSGPSVAGAAGAAGSFCDPRSREDAVAFFQSHRVPGSERRLKQALERIDACIEMKSLQSASMQSWLSQQTAAPRS